MASVFKPEGSKRYVIMYRGERDKRRKKIAYTDKQKSQQLANQLEDRAKQVRDGLADVKAEAYRDHERRPLADHIGDWQAALTARGRTPKHAKLSVDRVRRLVAIMFGAEPDEVDAKRMTRDECQKARENVTRLIAPARMSSLSAAKVQETLARIRDAGRSLETCNHYRRAVRGFVCWAWKEGRLRDNPLAGVAGFNAKEDRRHDRRTISLEELRRLIEAAQIGEPFRNMTGPARALCYRLAVTSGLRYSELASITPESFDWKAPSVTIQAAYAKNGQTATLPLPDDLVPDLAAYVADVPPGTPIFPMPGDRGARMLQNDLKAAGIPYRDSGGLVFDFHALRCQTATLLDAAGVTPRVVQRIMRHSTLELTGRYTRPRAVDIEAAAGMLPSLKPDGNKPESLAMTGTDSRPTCYPDATWNATQKNVDACNVQTGNALASSGERIRSPRLYPLSYGRR